jgi:hypothetical protein
MYNLFFNNQYNENKFVTTCEKEEVMKEIKNFIKQLNPNFKIYYIRAWEEDNKTWYDVGSHSEFFFIEEDNL